MRDDERIVEKVAAHYGRTGLAERILDALAAAGKDPDRLTLEDLAPLDQLHIRGLQATAELAALLELTPESRVLDVGCGIGGPSRYLARAFGCRVIGVDLTAEYVQVAAMLAERTGLSHLVEYRQADALALPFEPAAFDVVWTQHVAMNIRDKDRLYAEMRRVLRPGGLVAIYDILAGAAGPPQYPVPWARDHTTSFLIAPKELRARLRRSGFEIVSWLDTTEAGRAWHRELARRMEGRERPPIGVHVVLGPEFLEAGRNMVRNLEEDRVALIEVVARAV